MEEQVNATPTVNADPTVEELLKKLNDIKTTTVPKEDYDKAVEANKKLVNEVANNRPVARVEDGKPTRAQILQRCKDRTNALQEMSSMKQIESLCLNYRDMRELGMDTPGVEEENVKGLEQILKDANGDESMFKSLLDTRIKKSV